MVISTIIVTYLFSVHLVEQARTYNTNHVNINLQYLIKERAHALGTFLVVIAKAECIHKVQHYMTLLSC